MVDLTKLVFHSEYEAFKNNNVYTGSFNITGTTGVGINTRTHTKSLPVSPVLSDVVIGGRSEVGFSTPDNTNDPRPNNGWFKEGNIWVRGDDASYTNEPTKWVISWRISGSSIIFTANYVQQFTNTLTLTSEAVNYRIVDYSVA